LFCSLYFVIFCWFFLSHRYCSRGIYDKICLLYWLSYCARSKKEINKEKRDFSRVLIWQKIYLSKILSLLFIILHLNLLFSPLVLYFSFFILLFSIFFSTCIIYYFTRSLQKRKSQRKKVPIKLAQRAKAHWIKAFIYYTGFHLTYVPIPNPTGTPLRLLHCIC